MTTEFQGSIPLTLTYVNEELLEELAQLDWTPDPPPPPVCKKPKPIFARPAKLRYTHPRPLINLATGETVGFIRNPFPAFTSIMEEQ